MNKKNRTVLKEFVAANVVLKQMKVGKVRRNRVKVRKKRVNCPKFVENTNLMAEMAKNTIFQLSRLDYPTETNSDNGLSDL